MAVRHSFREHNRFYRDRLAGWSDTPGYWSGGYTVYYNDGGPASAPFFGVAICSDKDQYNRKVGRKLAMDRMMQLYTRYTQQEVIDGNFCVINIPDVQGEQEVRLWDAALLHCLDLVHDRFGDEKVEIRIVDFGPWQEKKKPKKEEEATDDE